ncbi:hypothetical protein K438DRAFT_1820839 [Mycena galopus ATCC 62051]|nr:hypothetical protein K438DRAFT_1820839 [Mycena galopus ATCC 62051]
MTIFLTHETRTRQPAQWSASPRPTHGAHCRDRIPFLRFRYLGTILGMPPNIQQIC